MGRRNLQGGNKTKAMARNDSYQKRETRIPETEEEKYAIVISVSGNGRFRVSTEDKTEHVAILPGSMRGHKKRSNYVGLGSFVLINNRSSWQTIKANSQADIVNVYDANEVERLGLIYMFQEKTSDNNVSFNMDDIMPSYEEQEDEEEILETIPENENGDIDFDAI